MSMAKEKEKTNPMFEKVLNIPEDTPNKLLGAAFITAELLAGKNDEPPIPLMTLAKTTIHRPVLMPSCAETSKAMT